MSSFGDASLPKQTSYIKNTLLLRATALRQDLTILKAAGPRGLKFETALGLRVRHRCVAVLLQAVSHFLANGQKENRNIRLRSDAENCRIELINKGGDDSVVTARLHMGAVLEQLVHEEWAAEGRQTSG